MSARCSFVMGHLQSDMLPLESLAHQTQPSRSRYVHTALPSHPAAASSLMLAPYLRCHRCSVGMHGPGKVLGAAHSHSRWHLDSTRVAYIYIMMMVSNIAGLSLGCLPSGRLVPLDRATHCYAQTDDSARPFDIAPAHLHPHVDPDKLTQFFMVSSLERGLHYALSKAMPHLYASISPDRDSLGRVGWYGSD